MEDLVSPRWLADALGAPDLRVLDATYLPLDPQRDAAAAYRAGQIPGARFLDLAGLSDHDDPLPAMAPPSRQFASRMAALGVARNDRIVLYDDSPQRTAARAWWLFRLFGAERVAILDGGLAAWRAAGHDVEAGRGEGDGESAIAAEATGFVRRGAGVADLADTRAALAAGVQVVDARGRPRFSGAEADPRPGVAPGHMPGARNLPYTLLIQPDGRWKPADELARAFTEAGVDPGRPIFFTCGSGVTAAVLLFGAYLLGGRDLTLYDGSWSEWGADPATPKAIG